jgi:hypothetical protein
MEVSGVSTDLSTLGSVHPGATVLVASGIISAASGDLPFSVLSDDAGRQDGAAA